MLIKVSEKRNMDLSESYEKRNIFGSDREKKTLKLFEGLDLGYAQTFRIQFKN